MDPPDERVTALKKAYAEILLNTAKEEAARIMASERKAQRFEHELKLAKEEALRMLLRIKHMMDAKINEAELTSLTQKKKIEELEAQLQEAEDIVRDLRQELGEVQSELEKATKINIPTQQQISPPDLSYFTSMYTRNSYNGIPDLPSIISRSKEPMHYRNGCTHRIRACDRNRLVQHLSSSKPRNMNIVKEDKAGKKIRNHEDENVSNLEKKEKSLPCWASFRKGKRGVRSRKITTICAQSPKTDHSISATDNGDSSENPSESSQILVSEKGESQIESKLDMTSTDQSTVITEEVVTVKSNNSSDVSISESILEKINSPSETDLGKIVSPSETDLGKINSPSETNLGKINSPSETSSEIINDNNRFRYTFQRKRKRGSLLKTNQDVSLTNNASVKIQVTDETASLKKSAPLENAA